MRNRLHFGVAASIALSAAAHASCSDSSKSLVRDAYPEAKTDFAAPELRPDLETDLRGNPDLPNADAAMPDEAHDTANADAAMLDRALDTARDRLGDLPGRDVPIDTAADAPKAVDVTVDVLAAVDALDPSVRFVQVTTGSSHACGLRADGTVVCWATGDLYDPSGIPGGTFRAIQAAGNHTCGMRTDGTLACWGANNNHQSDPPAGTFAQFCTGSFFGCAMSSAGALTCWGGSTAFPSMNGPAGTYLSIGCATSVDGHPDPGEFDQEGVAKGAGKQEVARLAATA